MLPLVMGRDIDVNTRRTSPLLKSPISSWNPRRMFSGWNRELSIYVTRRTCLQVLVEGQIARRTSPHFFFLIYFTNLRSGNDREPLTVLPNGDV